MVSVRIRSAEPGDLAGLDAALRRLSAELGDTHRAQTETLERALFGAVPSAWAMIAEPDTQAHTEAHRQAEAKTKAGLRGAVLFSPVFSTMLGGAGVFVSDLWVESAGRGAGLGPALLRAAAERAGELWDAGFLRLTVHDHNTRACAFYDGLGFQRTEDASMMSLAGPAFERLRRMR